jgi:DNA polymerase III sliding clamp (beta) subunit (PCNA family)
LSVPRVPSTKRPSIPERSAAKVREALEKDIEKAFVFDDHRTRHPVGKQVAPGFIMAATDGHRALMVRGDGPKHADPFKAKRKHSVIVEKDFGERLLEVGTCRDTQNEWIHFDFTGGRLTLSAEQSGDFEASAEVESAFHKGPDTVLVLNYNYVKAGLGVWPLKISWTDEDNYVVFQPAQANLSDADDWYQIIMPVRLTKVAWATPKAKAS